MAPERALEILDKAAASVKKGRAFHIKCAQAVEALRAAIAPKPEPEAKAKENE